MKKFTKSLKAIVLLLALITTKQSLSQTCTASFNWSAGANGLISFTSTSVPVNSITTQYYWTFGNGNTFTTVGSPIANQTYTANGTYTVQLFFLTPATCSNVVTQTITITNASGCGLNANFTSSPSSNGNVNFFNTTTGTVVGTTYFWSYGDGGTSTAFSNFHNYATNGLYTVTLTANNNSIPACVSTKTLLINVTSNCTLVANFNSSAGANGVYNFTSTSVGTNTLNTIYWWSFGNGNSNSGLNMNTSSQTYTANGSYVVWLTIQTSVPSCTNTVSNTITVSNVTGNPCNLNANFSSTQPGGGVVNFNNTTTGTSGAVSYAWAFGDGGTSTSTSQAHTYANSGLYTVTLTANNNYSYVCVSTKTAVVNVNLCGLTANFTYSTAANGQVNFFNGSSGTSSITSYAWTFGNGQTSNSQNPSITYTANGSYPVILTISNGGPACSDTVAYTIVINNITGPCNLVASFSHTVGANGLVNFFSTSLGTNSVTTYFWNFGDGTSGSGANPSHVYSTSGTHVVVLTAMNGSTLCVNSSTQSINITGIPCVANANFTLSPTLVPQFWTATPAYPWNVIAASWSWGDGSSSNLLYTSHSYSAAGLYSICLTVTVSCGSTASACSTYSVYKMSSSANIIQVNVVEPGLVTVGLQDVSIESINYNLFPNPNNGSFTLQFNNANYDKLNISVYNLMGQEVYKSATEKFQGALTKEIQLEGLTNGVYFIQFDNEHETRTGKLVINK